MRPYAEPAYRTAVQLLAAGGYWCWLCGAPATTPDHVPALCEHRHVTGSGCCVLRPACMPCQKSTGAAAGNRRRRRARVAVAGLAPGSGSSVAVRLGSPVDRGQRRTLPSLRPDPPRFPGKSHAGPKSPVHPVPPSHSGAEQVDIGL